MGDKFGCSVPTAHTPGGQLTELEILQLTTLIRDGIPASKACETLGIPQASLTRRLTEARRAAKGATEEERSGQRYYKLLLTYEDAQRQRSKTLRKLRGRPE